MARHTIPALQRARSGMVGPIQRRWLVLLLMGLPLVAAGADLSVRVLEKATGQPLPDASVCLGTSADPVQLGAQRSSQDGEVVYEDIPAAPLTLIVSRSGYGSERRALAAASVDRELTVLLGEGPRGAFSCEVGPATSPAPTPAFRPSFQLDRGAAVTADREVSLNFAAEGANEYRASESRDFPEAQWRPIEGAPTFELSAGPGRKTVYLQLRRYREAEGATLETRSEVLSDSIRLR